MTATARIRLEPLDLTQTLGCGQTFRWRPLPDGSWKGPLGDQLFSLKTAGSILEIRSNPGSSRAKNLVADHLRATDDVLSIQRALSGRDPKLASGIGELRGLRIVKIDEWECLISFALATYANIPRISKMIETLASNYGRRILDDRFSFPALEDLKKASVSDLSKCGLGYRAKYIHAMCHELSEESIEHLKRLGYEDLRAELKEFPGVGDKVADCVALFGFGKLESFPIDVWMERALSRLYGQKGSHEMFGEFAGYAQEYLYYNERVHAPNGSCLFSKQRTNR
jgi:N-glycosylase/DNA lyase